MSITGIIWSSAQGKCPQCRKDNLFKEQNPYKLSSLYEMNVKCKNCNLNFSPEPRFYDGAMFVSYGLNVIVVAAVFIASIIIAEDPNAWIMSSIVISISIVLSPITFRLSRSLWLHIFVKHDSTISS